MLSFLVSVRESDVYFRSGAGTPQLLDDSKTKSKLSNSFTGGALDLETDPYDVDSDLAMHFMTCYFDFVNSATYAMFPREAFFKWFAECRTKTFDDRMLLYAMLALGTIYSPRPDRRETAKKLNIVARRAIEKSIGRFTLQLVQTRIIVALYHFAIGDNERAWDFWGAGFRAATSIDLCREPKLEGKRRGVYGFEDELLKECYRRTMWSAYLIDVCTSQSFTLFSD